METPTLTPEQARIVEIGRALVKSGTDPRDAVTIARFTQAVFPDTPLEKLSIFADSRASARSYDRDPFDGYAPTECDRCGCEPCDCAQMDAANEGIDDGPDGDDSLTKAGN